MPGQRKRHGGALRGDEDEENNNEEESPFDYEMEPREDEEERFSVLPAGQRAPAQVPPPAETKSRLEAFRAYIAKRGLVGLRFFRHTENFDVAPDVPTPRRTGSYKLAAMELMEVKGSDGVMHHAVLVKGDPEGYGRSGTVGTEALEVSVKSNYTTIGGKVVFSAACGNVNAFVDGTRTIGPGQVETFLFARFRVRNPYISRILLKLRSISQGDKPGVGGVMVWIAKGNPTLAAAVTDVRWISSEEISDTMRTFNRPFDVYLSVVDESVSACPVPTDDDTYYLCVQPDGGAIVTLATRDDGAGEFWPFFEIYTLVGSASGGIGPGGLPATAVRSQSIQKLFGQDPIMPGAAPDTLFTLADGVTIANRGLFPGPLAAGDNANDASLAGASPSTFDFWEVVMKPFVLPRGQSKIKIKFTPAGGNSVSAITVALLKNSAAGTTVVATRTFGALAFVAVQEIAIPLTITGDVTYNIGENFGIRVTLTHNAVGTLNLNHTRGTDESHVEIAISA